MGDLGCDGDGTHLQCRLCGGGDFLTVPCPASSCKFPSHPYVPYYWDADCEIGTLGCWADGVHAQCRFCAERPFETVACPEPTAPPQNECSWPQRGEPSVPYFWDATCEVGLLGCWADGIHPSCRFCGAGVYSEIACPEGIGANATGGSTNLRGNSSRSR